MPIKQRRIARRKTAFHEAGHAVEAYTLHVPFRSVSIRPEADSLGHVLFDKRPEWLETESNVYEGGRAMEWLRRSAQISLAGQIAEAILAGRRPAGYSHASDDAHAGDYAFSMCSQDKEALGLAQLARCPNSKSPSVTICVACGGNTRR